MKRPNNPLRRTSAAEATDALIAYGLAEAELPNPDVDPQQRVVTLILIPG